MLSVIILYVVVPTMKGLKMGRFGDDRFFAVLQHLKKDSRFSFCKMSKSTFGRFSLENRKKSLEKTEIRLLAKRQR